MNEAGTTGITVGGAVVPNAWRAGLVLAPLDGMAFEHVSVAERVAFGRPMDPDRDPEFIHSVPRPATVLIGRILIAAIFLTSGIAKMTDPAGAVGYMKAAGIPSADVLVWVAALAEVLGGLAVLFGFLTRVAAIGLLVFLAAATVTFHAFWNVTGAEQKMQMVNFMKNLAIGGGLMMLVANGAGRYSADYALRRPMSP
jgi:putative oxidoreductase